MKKHSYYCLCGGCVEDAYSRACSSNPNDQPKWAQILSLLDRVEWVNEIVQEPIEFPRDLRDELNKLEESTKERVCEWGVVESGVYIDGHGYKVHHDVWLKPWCSSCGGKIKETKPTGAEREG